MGSVTRRTTLREDGTTVVRYDVQVKRRGGQRKSKTFQTLGAAKRWARETEVAIERGAWTDPTVAERTKLKQVIGWYLDEVSPLLKAGDRDRSPARRLIERLGAMSVAQLEPRHLADYRDARLADPVRKPGTDFQAAEKVGARSVVGELGLLQRALKHATAEKGIPLPRGLPTLLVKKPSLAHGRDRRLSTPEYEALISAAHRPPSGPESSRSVWLESIIVIAVETGMRRSEILSLTWEQVDLERRFIRLEVGKTKNGEGRRIPLSTRAIRALQAIPQSKVGRVFPISGDALENQWKGARARAGLSDLHFHDLRHEATSRLFELGLNPIEVAAITGHKNLQMLKRYAHLNVELLANRLG